MAHAIEATDRFGEVRKNGQRAWHGLGLEIEEGLTAEDAFDQIGLGWRTTLAPISAEVEVAGDDGMPTTQRIELGGANPPRAHIRTDTMKLLGMVTAQYKPFENHELARFADGLAGADAACSIETAGSLYNGRRVFALVKLPNVIRAAADDVLDQYVLVQNGHGGAAPLSCYPTSVRVVCANTLRWSESDLAKGIRFQHSGDFDEKLKQAKTVLGVALQESDKFQEQVTALASRHLTAQETRDLMVQIYDSCFGAMPDEFSVAAEVRTRLEKKRANLIEQWEANLQNERQSIKGIRGTAWAAYNAVSEFHDHERGRFGGVHESDARVASNIFGISHQHKTKAFKAALALV